jgi:hypothetical protein
MSRENQNNNLIQKPVVCPLVKGSPHRGRRVFTDEFIALVRKDLQDEGRVCKTDGLPFTWIAQEPKTPWLFVLACDHCIDKAKLYHGPAYVFQRL